MSARKLEPDWAAAHDERWSWCSQRHEHVHTDDLNRGSYVDGHPAGPIWTLVTPEATR